MRVKEVIKMTIEGAMERTVTKTSSCTPEDTSAGCPSCCREKVTPGALISPVPVQDDKNKVIANNRSTNK
jgi:hypothetical protein